MDHLAPDPRSTVPLPEAYTPKHTHSEAVNLHSKAAPCMNSRTLPLHTSEVSEMTRMKHWVVSIPLSSGELHSGGYILGLWGYILKAYRKLCWRGFSPGRLHAETITFLGGAQ